MFCKSCGVENEASAKFCVSCGAVMDEASSQEPTINEPVYDAPEYAQYEYVAPVQKSKAPLFIALGAAVVVVLIILGVVGYMQTTPEAVANNFYKGFLNKDVNAVLDNMYLPANTTPIPRADIQKELDSIPANVDIKSLKVSLVAPASYTGTLEKEITINGNKVTDFKTVYVSVTVDGTEKSNAIYLIKSGKTFLIFDKWVLYNGM
ncbi:MAG: zinc-ribbon domain-containing protein [Bacillota bacterium]